MGILQQARKDWNRHITSTSGAGEDITFVSVDGTQTANVRGLAMSHHLKFDTDGSAVNSKNTHITVYEKDLVNQGYTVRDAKDVVALHKHKVSYPDSTGVIRDYLVLEYFPDETVGIITCILESYAPIN